MNNLLPAERRRTVVVLTVDEYRGLLRDPERVDLAEDPEAQLLPFTDSGVGANPVADLLRAQGLFRPGMLAVQSPYSADRYVPGNEAVTEFTVEKSLLLAQLAKLLGATKVSFEDVRAEVAKESMSGSVKGKTVTASAASEGSRSIASEVRERLNGEHVFPGSEPDIDGARELLMSSRLLSDPHLRALIDLRSGTNAMSRQEIHVSGTREAAGNLSAALRIAGGPGKLKLAGFSSEMASQWERKIQVDIKTIIEF